MSFDRIEAENPMDARAFYNLAKFYHKKGDLDLAIKCYLEALRVNQQIVLESPQRKGESKPGTREAVPLDREMIDLFAGLGDAYLAQKKWDDAIDNYTKSIQLNPEYPKLFMGAEWPLWARVSPIRQ